MNRKLKILSSDDDEGIRSFLFSMLGEHGHEVDFARNSDDVFKSLHRANYDLLILDVNTPGINGYQVAAKISNELPKRPKILIFTGRDTHAEELQFISSGADSIIHKGASCEEILRTINALFEESHLSSVPLPHPEPVCAPEEEKTEVAPATERDINEDLQFCISKLEQVETDMRIRKRRHDELIQEVLTEKHASRKINDDFGKLRADLNRLKKLVIVSFTTAGIGLVAALFRG